MDSEKEIVRKWIVLDSLGNKVEENQISKIENNSIILEHWTGSQGGTGTSHNYHDKSDSTWNQLWIDNKGNILKLKGGLKSGKMMLNSNLVKVDNDWPYDKITWFQNKDSTVSQLWEIYSIEDKLMNTVFLGIFHKKK